MFPTTEQRITDQARAIRKNGWLTDMEIEGIKRRVLNEERQECEEMPERQDQDDVNNETDDTEEPCVNENSHMEQSEEYSELEDEEKGILNRIREIMLQEEYEEITSFKKVDRWQLNVITQRVNKLIKHIETKNITETNNLMRAISTFIAEKIGLKRGRRENQQKEPWWKRRIQRDINELRKHISIMDRERRGELRTRRKYLEIEKKYQVDRKGLLVVIEELKQRLTAKAAKIRRYEQRIHQYRQNRLFSTDQKRFYQELDGGITYDRTVPDAEESLKFWSDIWYNGGKQHNNEAEWLKHLKEGQNNASLFE